MTNTDNLLTRREQKSGIFYGYIVVICSFLILMIAFGINYSFGIFFNPILDEFGWSRAVTSIGYSLTVVISGIAGIITGRLCDAFGPRATIIGCGILLGLGCFLMSQVHAVWQLYIFYGLFIGVGFGGAMIPLSSIISRWFFSRRGLMTGIVLAGTGFGTIVMPALARSLLSSYDWRTSFIIFGIIAFVVTIPAALFLKRDPSTIGKQPYGMDKQSQKEVRDAAEAGLTFQQAIRTGRFWTIFAIYILFGYFVQAIMVHAVPHARALGIDAGSAAIIISLIGVGSLIGRITGGITSDRIGVKSTLSIALGIIVLAFIWVLFGDAIWMLYLFAVVFGLGYGAMIALQPLIGAKMFGLLSLGTIVGVIIFAYALGGAVGPAITGYIFDVTQSYHLALIICTIMAAGALAMTFVLKKPRQKGNL